MLHLRRLLWMRSARRPTRPVSLAQQALARPPRQAHLALRPWAPRGIDNPHPADVPLHFGIDGGRRLPRAALPASTRVFTVVGRLEVFRGWEI